MKVKNKQARRYLRKVRSWLPFGGDLRRDMLEKVGYDLSVLCEEEPQADYQAIVRRLGTPQQIASACVEEAESAELLRILRIRKRILASVFLCVTLVVAIWAGAITYMVHSHAHKIQSFQGVVTVTEVERIEFDDNGNIISVTPTDTSMNEGE